MAGRLRIRGGSTLSRPVVSVDYEAITRERPVYFQVVNRRIPYPYGRSRIVYIGTTKRGLDRIMESIAERAPSVFERYGVTKLEVFEIDCRPRQRVKTWRKLERACLLTFRELHGEVPLLNDRGRNMLVDDEFEYFAKETVAGIIAKIGG